MAVVNSQKGRMLIRSCVNGNVTTSLAAQYESESYVSKPNYPRRKFPVDPWAAGTSLSVTVTEQSRTYATRYTSQSNWQSGPTALFGVSAGAPPGGALPARYDIVDAKLLSQIKDMNVNLAQFMAEYRQACNMFVSLAKDLWSTFRSLRSGRAFSDFVKILSSPRSSKEREIANRWLQYQYGLKPFMSDLFGICEVLTKRIQEGKYLYVRATHKERSVFSLAGQAGTGALQSWDCETSTRARARFKVQDSSLKGLAETGITNPLLLIWELIPYSFVVDWMFPVGQFLSSLDALVGVTSLSVIRGTKQQYTATATVYGGKHILKSVSLVRQTPSGVLALPKFGYKPSTSLTAVLNGLALLTQIRTGRA
jgi:hypothetical protein